MKHENNEKAISSGQVGTKILHGGKPPPACLFEGGPLAIILGLTHSTDIQGLVLTRCVTDVMNCKMRARIRRRFFNFISRKFCLCRQVYHLLDSITLTGTQRVLFPLRGGLLLPLSLPKLPLRSPSSGATSSFGGGAPVVIFFIVNPICTSRWMGPKGCL